MIFQCRIEDAQNQSGNHGFKNVEVVIGDELKGIESLTQEILGYLTYDDKEEDLIGDEIPQYNAYQYFLQAKEIWNQDYQKTEELLRKVIDINPEFTQASILLSTLYYNTRKYEVVDSVLRAVELENELSRAERYNIMYLKSLVNGENGIAYEAHQRLNEYHSSNFPVIIESMVTAIEFVNKPQEAIQYYENMPVEKLSPEKCQYCFQGNEFKAIAHLENSEPDLAIASLKD